MYISRISQRLQAQLMLNDTWRETMQATADSAIRQSSSPTDGNNYSSITPATMEELRPPMVQAAQQSIPQDVEREALQLLSVAVAQSNTQHFHSHR